MILNFGFGFDVVNVGNKLQISISKGVKTGDRLKREGDQELIQNSKGDDNITFHPNYDYIIKSNTNYFLLGGGIKIRYEWDGTSKFQDEHKKTYMALLRESQAGLSIPFDESKYKEGAGFMEHEVFHANRAKKWLPSPLQYEPYCTTAEIQALVDDTILVCPMQHDLGWTFEFIDIEKEETIESNKQGEEMYILFGCSCSVGSTQISQFHVKKQTSAQLQIKNTSDSLGSLIRIYK